MKTDYVKGDLVRIVNLDGTGLTQNYLVGCIVTIFRVDEKYALPIVLDVFDVSRTGTMLLYFNYQNVEPVDGPADRIANAIAAIENSWVYKSLACCNTLDESEKSYQLFQEVLEILKGGTE